MANSRKKSGAKAKKLLGKRESGDDLKTQLILKKYKAKSEEKVLKMETTTEGFSDCRVELSETKSDHANLILEKEKMGRLDESPDFVEEVAARKRKKTLFVDHLPPETKISDIIDFFHNVGEVVCITLIVNRKGEHQGNGFVEFASANEAKKALEKKNGEYLHDQKIYVDVFKDNTRRPKYCIEHKVVCYEDYLRRKSLLIEENETVEGHDEDTNSVKEVAIRKKTLFVADLSPQTEIIDVYKFFHNVGQVVSLRLIANHKGKRVGCGFVEFASANEAKKALRKKKGEYLQDHKIFLDVAKIAPKYNLAEKLWCEDSLRQESRLIEEDETVERIDDDPDYVEEVAAESKTLFVGNLSPRTTILEICEFFHWFGEIVHVRLDVDHKGKHAGYGFVEFASADEAKEESTYSLRPKYNLAEMLWYKDYRQQESLRMEEDKTVTGLVQEISVSKKTLFLTNLPPQSGILDIYDFFCWTGGIVRQRLIVNHEGKHVGCAFVVFASEFDAEQALKLKKGRFLHDHKIFLDVVKIPLYPSRPKYNLAEKLWYEDYLIRGAKPSARFCGTKTTCVDEEEIETGTN